MSLNHRFKEFSTILPEDTVNAIKADGDKSYSNGLIGKCETRTKRDLVEPFFS